MMLSRRFNVLFKIRMVCATAIVTNDLTLFTSNLNENYAAHSCRVTRARVHKFDVNNRTSTVDRNIMKNVSRKLVTSNANINTDNVSLNSLTSIMDDLESNDDSISETTSLMLLRSCGRMLQNEILEVRQELLNRVWNHLKKGKCKLTINHYHALLEAYIDNDQIIEQNKFLEGMTIVPEYDTYSLLLRVPNSNGSPFADSILSMLMENSLPIGKKICDALMSAYAANGDVEGIMRTARLMEERDLKGTSLRDGYLTYANARNGNVEALTDALKNGVSIPDIMRLVKYISLSNNGAHIPAVLSHVQSLTVKREDLINTVAQLVHADHVLDAYEIITRVSVDENVQDPRRSLLSQFLELIIKANKDLNTMKQIIDRIEKEYCYTDVWNQAIELAVKQNGGVVDLKLLDEMKGMETLKTEHFHPIFVYIRRQNSKHDDVYHVTKRMQALGVEIDRETLVNYVLPCIDFSYPVAAVTKLCHHGVPLSSVVEPTVQHLIKAGKLLDAMSVCSMFKKRIDCQPVLDPLYQYYRTSKNIIICANFLFQSTYNGLGFVATFVKKIIKDCDKPEVIDDLYKFLIASKHYNATISVVDARYMEEKILNLDLSKDFKRKLLTLISSIKQKMHQNCNIGAYIHPQYMNLDQLRAHFDELKTKSKHARGALRKLLMAACRHDHDELVKQLVEEMNRFEFNWTPGMRLNLFDYYVKNEKIEEALSELNEIQSKFEHFKIDNFKILRCATLLVKLNRVEEAVNLIDKCTWVNHKPDAHSQIDELLSLMIRNNCLEHTSKMANCLVGRGYYENTMYTYRYLILAYILNGDVSSGVNLFTNCVKLFNKTPAKQELLVELMKLSSAEPSMKRDCDYRIKQVYELVTQVHGRSIADVNLLIAFALSDRTSDLKNLLMTGEIKQLLVVQQFAYLKEDDVMKSTLAILEAKNKSMSVELICNMALSMCDRRGDVGRGMELERKMKEKNVKVKKALQKCFTQLLETNKKGVPLNMAIDKKGVEQIV